MNSFWEEKTLWKVKFDISELFIRYNKDSCYELIAVGVNIYFYGCVSLLDPYSAVSLCIFVYVCVCVCVRSNQSGSKKTHYVSHLSKLIVCTPHPSWQGGVKPPTKFSKREGLDRISSFREGLLGERGRLFFRGRGAVFTKKLTKVGNI